MMTRDDIIRMAREATGLPIEDGTPAAQKFERFAALVATAEREACAQIARQTCSPLSSDYGNGYNQAALDIEEAILARSQPEIVPQGSPSIQAGKHCYEVGRECQWETLPAPQVGSRCKCCGDTVPF